MDSIKNPYSYVGRVKVPPAWVSSNGYENTGMVVHSMLGLFTSAATNQRGCQKSSQIKQILIDRLIDLIISVVRVLLSWTVDDWLVHDSKFSRQRSRLFTRRQSRPVHRALPNVRIR